MIAGGNGNNTETGNKVSEGKENVGGKMSGRVVAGLEGELERKKKK